MGSSNFTLTVPSAGLYTISIAHPQSGNVTVTCSKANILNQIDQGYSVSAVNLYANNAGTITVSVTSDPQSSLGSLSPVYLEAFPVSKPVPEFPGFLPPFTVCIVLLAALLVAKRIRYNTK